MMKNYKNLLAFLFMAVSLSIVNAQLIISEPFDYPAGNVAGKNGGTGFSTAWSSTGTSAATFIGSDDAATITAGSIGATGKGNKGKFCTQVDKNTRWDRKFASPTLDGADGQVYWISFWYNNTLSEAESVFGIAGQLIFMNDPNSAIDADQRLGFGKTSNFPNLSLNGFTVFSRASPSGTMAAPACAARNWGHFPEANRKSSTGKYFVLVKITKGEFTETPPGETAAVKFDGVRTWLFDAPPATETAFTTARPIGDLTDTVTNATTVAPVKTRVLRADNTAGNCVKGGVTGLRIRVERGGANSALYCPEFDEIRIGRTFADVTSTTSSADDLVKLSAQITPNPAKTNLFISLDEDAKKASVSVFDMLGRSVLSNKFTGSQAEINVESLMKGMYFINIQADGKTITQKFVKE
jgi:Secretion system C-terminal sorting domain